jgi:hypothetical protein
MNEREFAEYVMSQTERYLVVIPQKGELFGIEMLLTEKQKELWEENYEVLPFNEESFKIFRKKLIEWNNAHPGETIETEELPGDIIVHNGRKIKCLFLA